ncbi:NlpC/P60 family protein [Hyunsoonleella rubra]|uniref:NlpC/P60 family protein n=1 Tax=Hyunsoonleella rubra TaxID=1737062 RepID=A0ABW5TAP1_9FLAO
MKISIKKILLLLCFFAINGTLISQNSVDGIIGEKGSNNPILNATVTIDINGNHFVRTTDLSGKFQFGGIVPEGRWFIAIRKEGYEDVDWNEFEVKDKRTDLGVVFMEITKKERKRRDKERKKLEKLKKKKDKHKAPEPKIEEQPVVEPEKEILPVAKTTASNYVALQEKYGKILGVEPSEITNLLLYEFIEKWIGTPYSLSGETESGIDCSSFTQRLFNEVYGIYLERIAQRQYESDNTNDFGDKNYLEEGDLLFFGSSRQNITHVGVYLNNDKFVHSTSYKKDTGNSGVKISSLKHRHWKNLYIRAGRRTDNNGK